MIQSGRVWLMTASLLMVLTATGCGNKGPLTVVIPDNVLDTSVDASEDLTPGADDNDSNEAQKRKPMSSASS